jgi:hypothetical protein
MASPQYAIANAGSGFLRLDKRLARIVVLERMQQQDALDEQRLRRCGARGREFDDAEFLGGNNPAEAGCRNGQREGEGSESHRGNIPVQENGRVVFDPPACRPLGR